MLSGIYAIVNIHNDKVYVGSAKSIKARWQVHICQLEGNYHHNKYLQRVFNKYKNCFIFTVIEYCEPVKLIEREQFWIDNLKPEYNLHMIAASALGHKWSEETKLKQKNKIISKAHRKIVSEANKKRVGVKYNVNKEHTTRKCKCEDCLVIKRIKRKQWREKQKKENYELYVANQKRWDTNRKSRRLDFTMV